MKDHLGEFEELVLLVVAGLGNSAYGLAIGEEIKSQVGRRCSIGAIHATVERLERKGLVETYMGETSSKRGGKRKRIVRITTSGENALRKSRDLKLALWAKIPTLAVADMIETKR